MPGFIVQVGTVITCPHGGQVQIAPGNPRVKLNGMPVATMADQALVVGCAFAVGPKPQPCVRVQWFTPATRVVAGAFVILQSTQGMCFSADQIPNGPPIILAPQPRVTGM